MTEQAVKIITMDPASASVINANRFVTITASGIVQNNVAGGVVVGIARDASASGSTRAIAVTDIMGGGIAEVEAGAAITAGDRVQSADDGQAMEAAGSGVVCGFAMNTVAAAGEIVTIKLGSSGRLS